jgi:hypothetical protein
MVEFETASREFIDLAARQTGVDLPGQARAGDVDRSGVPRHPPWANHGPTQPSPLRLSRPRSARRKADVAEAGRQTLGSGRREPLTDDDSGLAQQAHELAARPQSKRRP